MIKCGWETYNIVGIMFSINFHISIIKFVIIPFFYFRKIEYIIRLSINSYSKTQVDGKAWLLVQWYMLRALFFKFVFICECVTHVASSIIYGSTLHLKKNFSFCLHKCPLFNDWVTFLTLVDSRTKAYI